VNSLASVKRLKEFMLKVVRVTGTRGSGEEERNLAGDDDTQCMV